MKNVSQILTSLQHKPQYHRLLEHKCIDRLKTSLLPSIQKFIKYGYIRNNTLTFITSLKLNKYDEKNTIDMIKTILNSPMILQSEKFIECIDVKIDDVKFFTDYNPVQKVQIYTTSSHQLAYRERAKGDIEVKIKDEKLQHIAKNILEIIKKR